MTIHTGRIKGYDFGNLLHNLLLSEGYKEVSTEITTDGRVYQSSPTSEDKFFIRVIDPKNRYLEVGVYEDYKPSPVIGLPGTFTNGFTATCVMWNTSTHYDGMEVDYIINITNKRVLIYVEGMKAQANKISSMTYLGLPKRISANDKEGKFAGICYTASGPYDNHNTFYSLRSRNEAPLHAYLLDFYLPNRSLGWGEKLFFSPILVGSTAEGVRGELEGIRIIERTDKGHEIGHGDTFVQDGKRYKLVECTSYGYDTLHTGYDYLIEI